MTRIRFVPVVHDGQQTNVLVADQMAQPGISRGAGAEAIRFADLQEQARQCPGVIGAVAFRETVDVAEAPGLASAPPPDAQARQAVRDAFDRACAAAGGGPADGAPLVGPGGTGMVGDGGLSVNDLRIPAGSMIISPEVSAHLEQVFSAVREIVNEENQGHPIVGAAQAVVVRWRAFVAAFPGMRLGL